MRIRASERTPPVLGLLAAALLAAGAAAYGQQPAANPPQPTPPGKEESVPGTQRQRSAVPSVEGGKAEGKDKEKGLEDLLAQALKDNPDIRVAEAKLHEAEAELDRTRLQVLQKVATLHADVLRARAKVAYAEQQLKRFQNLHEQKAIDKAVLDEAENALAGAKAELASLEAQMPALLGKPPEKAATPYERAVQRGLRFLGEPQREQESTTAFALRSLAASQEQAVQGTVAEKLRKALDAPLSAKFQDTPFAQVLAHLEDQTGIAIRSSLGQSKDSNPSITLWLKEPLPLRAVLQALEDTFPRRAAGDVRFVVREYGLLAAFADSLPPDAVTVDQFLRSERSAKARDAKNPPPGDLEGTVKAVNAESGLLTLSLGSDDGLQKGHTLEVYRLSPAKYLGTVRVIQVTPRESVAQPVSRPTGPIQPGDHVASKILGQ